MSGTKRFALRRLKSRNANGSGWLPLSVVLSFALAAPVQAQRLWLPAEEQDAVNDAIIRGVDYLKRTQQKSGTWAKVGVGQRIGYAILPGLTLMECGVPASDPSIQQAAQYLRARAGKLDTTYDLSLGILFLDRLGDPKDKKIIQTFALRLVAGQSATGGWGYKCPLLPARSQMELLIALRHLDPRPNGIPGIAGEPGGLPGIAGGPGENPGDLAPIVQGPGGSPLTGVAGQPGEPSLSGGLAGSGLGEPLSPQEPIPAPPSRWRDCLGLGRLDRRESEPLDRDAEEQATQKEAPTKPDDHAKPAPPKPDQAYVIPERLRALPVVQDPALHDLSDPPWMLDAHRLRHARDLLHISEDPPGMRDNLILTSTDNSNTQFAILALWTAQRYDVPMNRTLNLIVRRYVTSQNLDGSWTYLYRFGGAFQHEFFSSAGAMTCVGLIGLAVGHGMAQPLPAGQPVQDPRILQALTALYLMVGKPTDRLTKVPLQNLYFLWSLQRVAVLYRMPAIGDKDWYRWGAQMLVTNQDLKGSWSGGGYPGNSPTLDTCLALLFLKRANLAKDLTAKLPFKAADLNHGIMQKQKPPPSLAMTTTTPKSPESLESVKKTILPVKPSKQEAADNLLAKPLSSPQGTASAGTAVEERPSDSGSKKKWIVLAMLVFVLFAGCSVLVLFAARRRDEEEEKPDKPKKRKNKPKKLPSISRPYREGKSGLFRDSSAP
jgi:hypothetical protein